MGGRGKGWQGQQYGTDTRHGSWQLWRGAKPSPRSEAPWKPSREPAFPSYDREPAKGLGKDARLAESLQIAGVGGFGSALQTALNAARKAEQKVLKLHQAKAAADDQWNNFCKKLKDGYIKEKNRYQNCLERVQQDLQEAEKAMAAARAGVTRAAHEATSQSEGPTVPVLNAEEEYTEQMFASWDAETAPDWGGVFNRAMEAAPAAITPQRSMSAMPRTPTATVELSAQQAQAYYAMLAQSGCALRDPYMAASPMAVPPEQVRPSGETPERKEFSHGIPSSTGTARFGYSPHTCQRDPSRPRVPTAEEAPRPNIKDASKHAATDLPAGSGLADKLAAKRCVAKATMPFRGHGQIHEEPPGNGTRSIRIVNDDEGDEGHPPEPDQEMEQDLL